MVRPFQRRVMARQAVKAGATSIAHAGRTFGLSQSCYHYLAKNREDNAVIADWLVRLTSAYRDWGFDLCFLHLRNVKRFKWNHKRVYRIYRYLELNLRIKPRKRLIRPIPEPLAVPEAIDQTWPMDFMHDQLTDVRSLRRLNILDDFNYQGLAMEVDISLPASRVIRRLGQVIVWRGKPASIRCDNGPEYISGALQAGLSSRKLHCCKPARHPSAESLHRTLHPNGPLRLACQQLVQRYQSGAGDRDPLAMYIQQRAAEYGPPRYHPNANANLRRLVPHLAAAKNGGIADVLATTVE